MGGLRRRWEQCYRQLAVKGQCRRGFDPPEVWTASPGRLVCLAVFGTGEVEWGSLPHTPRPTNPRVTITHPSCKYKKTQENKHIHCVLPAFELFPFCSVLSAVFRPPRGDRTNSRSTLCKSALLSCSHDSTCGKLPSVILACPESSSNFDISPKYLVRHTLLGIGDLHHSSSQTAGYGS